MAKMAATEGAQRVIDRAVQMFGGHRGQRRLGGRTALSRDPAAAVYEGATEVQKLIIGRELLKPRN